MVKGGKVLIRGCTSVDLPSP